MQVRSDIKTQDEQKLFRVWKGLFPPQHLALCAKVFFYCLKKKNCDKESNFSVKSGALRREQPLSYTE